MGIEVLKMVTRRLQTGPHRVAPISTNGHQIGKSLRFTRNFSGVPSASRFRSGLQTEPLISPNAHWIGKNDRVKMQNTVFPLWKGGLSP